MKWIKKIMSIFRFPHCTMGDLNVGDITVALLSQDGSTKVGAVYAGDEVDFDGFTKIVEVKEDVNV